MDVDAGGRLHVETRDGGEVGRIDAGRPQVRPSGAAPESEAAPVPARDETPAAVFAANVVRLRKSKGLTMEHVAWAVGEHHTAWGRIESGERKPDAGDGVQAGTWA